MRYCGESSINRPRCVTSDVSALVTRRLGIAVGLGLLAVTLLAAPCVEAQVFADPGFSSEVVATLPPFTPVGLAFAPDGRLFVWQKPGLVRIVKNGVLLSTPFADIREQVNQFGDRGLLGVALDPAFASNGFVYLLYTVEDGGDPNDGGPKTSRLSRITADPGNPDVALPGSEVVILDGIPSDSSSHSIGTVRFAPDGTVFVGSGDGAEFNFTDVLALRAQDLDSLNGKILRINPDGSAPVDNPFYDGSDTNRSKVWAYGLRNPFRFSLHPTSGEPLNGDVGWNAWEEVNYGRGANFGWPCYEGNVPQPSYQDQFIECQQLSPATLTPPLYTYNHATPDAFGVTGSTVIGGPIYTGLAYPTQYVGSLFIADYTGNWIKRVTLDPDGNMVGVLPFADSVEGPVALEQGLDGLLYYVALNSGEVRRVRFNGPLARASATPTSGYSPLAVTFSSAGSSAPNGGSLLYSWAFGDGATSTAPDPSHTYAAAGVATFTATLTVTDGDGQSSSDSVQITVGSTPPGASISAPQNGTVVFPGQTVFYQGSGSDLDDGPLSGASLSWMVLLHHNTHVHIVQTTSGSQGSVLIADHGAGEFAYEVVLTVRDSSGLVGTASVMLPVNPDGLLFPASLKFSPDSVEVGVASTGTVTLSAPAGASGAIVVLSSDNAAVTVPATVTVPAGSTTATFVATTSAVPGPTTVTVTATLNGLAPGTLVVNPVLAGRVAGYRFNEGVGTILGDASGSGNNGTIVGATWTAEGLAFDGVDDLVTIPDDPTLDLGNAGTISARVRIDALGRWHGVIAKGDANSDPAHNYAIEIVDINTARCIIGNGAASQALDSSITLAAGQFYYITCTWTGSTLSIFIDGALSASTTQRLTPAGNSAPLFIGQFGGDSDRLLGTIDEVRIYNRALTQAEIQQDMKTTIGSAGASPDTSPPTAPTGIAVSAIGASQIDVTWTAATDDVGVTAYLVERCQDAGCTTFAQVATTPGTTFGDTGLQAATSYTYRIRATDAAGNLGPYSPTATATTQAAPPPAQNLVAAYAFSEGSGTLVADTSGNANHGAITGAAWTTQGRFGNAVTFNGTTDFVSVADAAPLDLTAAGTIEAWVRLDAIGRWHGVLAKGAANSDAAHNYALEITDTNRVACALGNGAASVVALSTATLVAGQFYHLACTWNGTTLALFLDGALDTSTAQTLTPVANTAPLSIGQFGGNSDRLLGTIDEVRLYARALTLADIQQDMNTPVVLPTSDTTPPSAPSSLIASAVSASQITLSWTAATDDVGVTAYLVERCQDPGCATFTQVATTPDTTFGDTGLQAATSYSYRVRATDAAGNLGPYSPTATATTQAAPPPPQSLVAAYGLNEGAGTVVADASGNANHGTVVGTVAWTTQGRFGNALVFNGTNTRIAVTDAASLDLSIAGTIGAWVKLDALNQWHGVIAKGSANRDSAHNYGLEITDTNRVICILGDGTSSIDVQSTVTVVAGQFFHLACTWDGSTLSLFIDGVLNASTAQTLTPAANTAPLFIGQFGGNADRLRGTIDEVRIHNRALSAAEIQQDMATPIP